MTILEYRPSRIVAREHSLSEGSYPMKILTASDPHRHWEPPSAVAWAWLPGGEVSMPGGLDTSEIFSFQRARHVDMTSATFYSPRKTRIEMLARPRNSLQEKSIGFLAGPSSMKLLCLAPGKGKTFCAVADMAARGEAAMVFVDQEGLLRQWKDRLAEYAGLSEGPGGWAELAGSKTVDEAMADAVAGKGAAVYLASHRTMASWSEARGGPWALQRVFEVLGIGCKYYDEAHVEWRATLAVDLHTDVPRTVYLTATPSRSSRVEDRVYQRCFETVPRLGMEADSRGAYHSVVWLDVDTKPTAQEEKALDAARGFDVIGWSKRVASDQAWPSLWLPVESMLAMLWKKKPGARAAIVFKTNDLVARAAEEIAGSPVCAGRTVGLYSSGLSGTGDAKKSALSAQIILATERSFAKAIDVPDLEILVSCLPTSSKTIAEQMAGRLRGGSGLSAIYVHVTDSGYAACRRQKSLVRPTLARMARVEKQFLWSDLMAAGASP